MHSDSKTRAGWDELPADLHRTVEEVLGGPAIEAVTQSNGFSPGSADRVRTASGVRAFVKAVDRLRHSGTYDLHRRELAVMERMPPGVCAPRLLGSYVTDEWVGLVLEDVEGAHPGAAAAGRDVDAVLDALASLPRLAPADAAALPDAADEFAGDADGWRRLGADGALGELPGWARRSHDRLVAAAERVGAATAGEHLQHLDCRADNVLLDRHGVAWIIDWPWAGVGARWTDGACYLFDVRMRGEDVDVDEVLRRHPLFDGVADADIDALIAALTGGYLFKSRLPAPAGMPTLREFQRQEALTGLAWLEERWS